MMSKEWLAFSELFRSSCVLCFGRLPEKPLTEPESRHFSNDIEEKTGLVIGWKSLKNYSVAVMEPIVGKPTNPSAATLDTLARYLQGARTTTEALRKKEEAHFGYWFRYLGQFSTDEKEITAVEFKPAKKLGWVVLLIAVVLGSAWAFIHFSAKRSVTFTDDFQDVSLKHFRENNWFLLSEETSFWEKRSQSQGELTLFTLRGDSWRTPTEMPNIRNLLTREIPTNCFSTEVHFSDFIPSENWQQAGIILLEDTAYVGKSLRLSLAFNNFFGGVQMPDEVLIQAVAGYGKNYQNVEEVKHETLFSLSSEADRQVATYNLRHSALRIEKKDQQFRLLYAASQFENFSFKELSLYDFDMKPRYIGIFALKGFVDSASTVPVAVKLFRLDELGCE